MLLHSCSLQKEHIQTVHIPGAVGPAQIWCVCAQELDVVHTLDCLSINGGGVFCLPEPPVWWAEHTSLYSCLGQVWTMFRALFSPPEAYCRGSLWCRNTAMADSPQLWNFSVFGDYSAVNWNLDIGLTQVLGLTRSKVLLALHSLLISSPCMQTDACPEQQGWGLWCASGWSSQSTSAL